MDGLKLINSSFEIEFADKKYNVKKANIDKVILFQDRIVQLVDSKDAHFDVKAAAYCIFLILQEADSTVTEEWVMQNAPGDVDAYQIFEQLGFMSRQKVEIMKALTQRNAPAQPKKETPAPTGE